MHSRICGIHCIACILYKEMRLYTIKENMYTNESYINTVYMNCTCAWAGYHNCGCVPVYITIIVAVLVLHLWVCPSTTLVGVS